MALPRDEHPRLRVHGSTAAAGLPQPLLGSGWECDRTGSPELVHPDPTCFRSVGRDLASWSVRSEGLSVVTGPDSLQRFLYPNQGRFDIFMYVPSVELWKAKSACAAFAPAGLSSFFLLFPTFSYIFLLFHTCSYLFLLCPTCSYFFTRNH